MKQMVALFLCLAMLLLLPACHAPDTETPGTTPPRESVTAPTGENASESGIASVTESTAGTEPGTEAGSATESATESVTETVTETESATESATETGSGPVYSEGLEFEWVEEIGAYAVFDSGTCRDEEIRIPPTYQGEPVEQILDYAFYGSDAKRIILPDTVSAIGVEAFMNCRQLEEICLPSALVQIGERAFSGCTSLCRAVFEDGKLQAISERAFEGCTALSEVVFPERLTLIGKWAFVGCVALTDLRFPDSLLTIDEGAFSDCAGLVTLELPQALQVLGSDSFMRCTSLERVMLPKSVRNMGWSIFGSCRNLQTIRYAGTVSEWRSIFKCGKWHEGAGRVEIACSDGTIYDEYHP